ncbi:hypothetical protein CDL12_03299 [Handroanthus impetiginosus]|uniref:Uncharacterized protein n=1 Tax=Handroanthus impetiginosus TaxID=429701 RepID=A0A2G9I2M2_9LAMI|nr:hypothetical protein CDL12_03299 [Handroanthus impetiginosus]
MHSGFQIPGSDHNHHIIPPENSCTALLLSMNQPQILEQIHGGTLHQPLFPWLNHQHPGVGTAAHSSFFPVNFFRLGNVNEICISTDNNNRTVRCINEGEDAFLCGSEQYGVTEARDSNLLGIPYRWQNQEHTAVKQPWELLPQEASNENSEIVDSQKHREINCLESKSRVPFGELEAICKLLDTSMSNQTGPTGNVTSNPVGSNHEEAPAIIRKSAKRKKRKKRKEMTCNNNDEVINHMEQFFEGLVKIMMDHQENLQKKVAEVIERLDEERRERDEAWKKQESAYFKQEAEARAMEKTSAESREAIIVSYLEKITGQRISFST